MGDDVVAGIGRHADLVAPEDIQLAVRGDHDASRRIIDALHRPVFSTIYRILGRQFATEVEDIAQDVFLKVFASLHRFDLKRRVKLTTWVFSIVRNHCFDLTKKRRIKTTSLENKDGGTSRAMEPSDARKWEPPEAAVRSELGQQIEKALQGMPENQRLVFVLREYEGLDYKTIAQVMGSNEGTVKSRLHRAKLALRQELEIYAVPESRTHRRDN